MKHKLHSNASLTIAQRVEVKRLFENEKLSVSALATRFCVSATTIRRWIHRASPADKSSAPHRRRRRVTPAYEQAVKDYRAAHPHHGAKRIACELAARYAQANRGTIALILQAAGLTRPARRQKPRWHIPVGKHRVQCDVQELPAIKGNQGFEYKISFIHLRTRWKYSEIHPNQKSETLAQVYRRALERLPPFL